MTKNELIEHMAVCAGISKASANKALEAFLKALLHLLQNGNISLHYRIWDLVVYYERSLDGTKP